MAYAKQQFVVGTASYTPFVVATPCNRIIFRNVSGVIVTFRTNPSDATTTDTLNPNDQEVVDIPMSGGGPLFAVGAIPCYFLSTSTATILATLLGAT